MVGSLLGLTGVVGDSRPERFDAKQVTVVPVGNGVRIREVIDQDFGSAKRHGYERIIPNDFGVPTAITASSPNAPAQFAAGPTTLLNGDPATRIRIGNPDQTITGHHQYVLTYVLPDANLATDTLKLDIIDDRETLETKKFTVVLTGMELANLKCLVGPAGSTRPCPVVAEANSYRIEIAPLARREGISVFANIVRRREAVLPAIGAPLNSAAANHLPLAAAMLAMSTAVSAATFAFFRRRGRNEVAGGGAADAAFGPGGAANLGRDLGPTRLISDNELARLATTEFAPPKGLEPWQGAVLLSERISDDTVSAWISQHVATEAITVEEAHAGLILSGGPGYQKLPPVDQQLLYGLLGASGRVQTGTYIPSFAAGWKSIREHLQSRVTAAQWWRRGGPGGSSCLGAALPFTIFGVIFFGGFGLLMTVSASAVGAVFAVGAVSLIGAAALYATMSPSRTAAGSALALQTESFRRFLAASEGQHVEWAWNNGLLREYSAWAVSLGAAEAWGKALAASNVPMPQRVNTGPLVVASMSRSLQSTRTAPQSRSSSSGGGGGFSVGGGGGGGSSGSW